MSNYSVVVSQDVNDTTEIVRYFFRFVQTEFNELQRVVHASLSNASTEISDTQTSLRMLHLSIFLILTALNQDHAPYRRNGLKPHPSDWVGRPGRVSLNAVNEVQILLAHIDALVYPNICYEDCSDGELGCHADFDEVLRDHAANRGFDAEETDDELVADVVNDFDWKY